MYRYRLYGLCVLSDMEFPQLVPEPVEISDVPKIQIAQCKLIPDVMLEGEADGKKYEFGKVLCWLSNRTARLVVENGTRIRYSLKEGGKISALRNYILGFGMSMLAYQRNILAIHCSAVADEDGAVLIAGESGAGKSTLTTAFLEKGYRLMADDMAFVQTIGKETSVFPAFPYQKLCRNVALEKGYDLAELIYINEDKDKFLVPYTGEFGLEAVPVKAFVMLCVCDEGEVEVTRIQGIERAAVYTDNLFLRKLLGPRRYSPEFAQPCIEMAANVPTYYVGRNNQDDNAELVRAEVFRIIT